MARFSQYVREIGSAGPGEVFCDPSQSFPELWYSRGRWRAGDALHSFTDDYRQEFFWRRPQEGLMVALSACFAVAPDFTVWTDDPIEFKRWQAWRSATVAAFWQRAGVVAVPVVQFGSGIERYVRHGSAWAVRGSCDKAWHAELRRFVRRARCGLLLVFGVPVAPVPGVDVRQFSLYSRKGRAAQKGGRHGWQARA